MQLHCLGTAGYHPSEERHTSCYFLPESGIVLDAGTGMFRLAELIQTPSLDILLSHAHLDHILGLTFLLDVLHQHPVEKLRIWGEREKLDAIREHLFSRLLFPVQIQAEWCAIDDLVQFSIGDCNVTWRPQRHPGSSVGYRLQWEQKDLSLLYLTDTTGDTSADASRWYADADLMMHECYFLTAQAKWAEKTGHTWAGRLAEIAVAATPARLLMTHVNPLDDDPQAMLREVIDGLGDCGIEAAVANDGDVVNFGS